MDIDLIPIQKVLLPLLRKCSLPGNVKHGYEWTTDEGLLYDDLQVLRPPPL